ncbi:MAG: 2-oxo acid dehydrogenase subunit E2 [Chloroflexota bacterium]|nr:2-oxo acid dehydrogenase subunit E2 [Chloroflexota bacterium]
MSATPVILPKLGLTMEEGRVVSWLKKEGDRVESGEILFEVETDKATMEVEAPAAGYVRRLLVAPGETVPVTHVIAVITTSADEPLAEPAAAAAVPPAERAVASPAAAVPPGEPVVASPGAAVPPGEPVVASPGAPLPPGERVVASPAARKRADELGVDLSRVTPAKGGRISIDDVEAAAATSGGPAREPLSRMRRAIAESMTRSFRDVPQYSLSRDADMTAAGELRTREAVSYTDVLVATAARALRDHPRLAMRYEPDGLVPADGMHIGVAVALEDGLLVPVIRDADTKGLAAIARERAALQEGARAGRLPANAQGGAVFSISNLGQHGVDRFTALVNPPEAAILAVGRVRDQVVARAGAAAVRPVVILTLSVDHRVADGAQAAEFLADLAERLEGGAL